MNDEKTISGPRGTLVFGNLPEMRRDPLGLLMRAARDHGDVSRLRLVETAWLLNRPDDVRHVLVTKYANYAKARLTVRIKPIVGDGLLTSDGELWRRQRKLAQPAFHKTRLAAFADTMAGAAGEMLAEWERRPAMPLDVASAMSRLTLRAIGLTMLGVDLDADSGKVARSLATALEITNDRFARLLFLPSLPTPSNRRFDRAMAALDGLVEGIIDERRARAEDRGDLLSLFMGSEDAETGERMTDRQLRDEVMTMLLAGHETTSNALAWAFALLARDPRADAELAAECAAALGGRAATFDDLPRLQSARRTVLEAMRLYPPVWLFARTAKDADDLPSGHRVRAGRTVFVCPYALHRDPDLWPDPETFDPGRFTAERSADRHRAAYVPFAAGPRQCIGNEFALMEATIILAMTVSRWRLALPPGHVVEPEPSVTLRPKGGVPTFLVRRR